MKTISKALVGTVAAGAMAITSASPAFAGHRDGDGISVGDVIAGALIIGGIVAVASATNNNDRGYRDYGDGRYDNRDGDDRYGDDRYGDDRYENDRYGNNGYNNNGYGNRYGNRGNPRQAIEQCVRSAEQYAARRYGRADVTDIREVKDSRYGWQIKGRIAVDTQRGQWQRGRGNYGNGWGGDYRGYNNSMRGYDSGSFKCKFERGRIVDLDIDGIRGL
ncbi:hypothetical protein [Novosphingobium sp.]|uniref:hypothetical protein n=1 Tax=Novosphingobium sp. TaxID=1874826 RepID=UPI00286CAD53|nr:hypothetical protein [Novosphingobium sp.]